MIRKSPMLIATVLVLLIAVAVPHAGAQGDATCEPVVLPTPEPSQVPTNTDDDAAFQADVFSQVECAKVAAYPGPFANMPAAPPSPYAAPVGLAATPQPDIAVAETEAEPGSPLAHSGSETFVLAYLGTGLLAFGAVALGLRRRPVPK